MALRVVSSKYMGTEADGTVLTFIEGYSDSDDRATLPTKGVCQGSNVIEVDSGDWLFFREKTKEWLPKLNIED